MRTTNELLIELNAAVVQGDKASAATLADMIGHRLRDEMFKNGVAGPQGRDEDAMTGGFDVPPETLGIERRLTEGWEVTAVKIPSPVDFFRTAAGEAVPISNLQDVTLRMIGQRYGEALVIRAAEQRAEIEKDAGPR